MDKRKVLALLACAMAAFAVACTANTDVDPTDAGDTDAGIPDAGTIADSGPPALYTVGGAANGVLGTGLVLQDNAGDDLPLAANGSFAFASKLPPGSAYAVTIKRQPTSPWQTCTVGGGTGTVGTANVTSVTVDCTSNKHTVGGKVTGLVAAGFVILQNNAGDDLTVAANGAFTFAAPIDSGASYAVTVKTPPSSPTQTCTVSGDKGVIGFNDVASVKVDCVTNTYTVGGTISGLVGTGLTLQNDGGDDLAVSANGKFTFATPIASAVAYAVTIKTPPTSPSQTCVLGAATGTVGATNVTSVSVTCATNYAVGGSVTGLSGAGLVLQQNFGDDLAISANGAFAFATLIVSGSNYFVSIKTQPVSPSQRCVLVNRSGIVSNGNVTDVIVSCATVLAMAQGSPQGVAVDATSVYWTNATSVTGTVMKMPVGGGVPVTLASVQDQPMALAVDATNVYWTNRGGFGTGTVMKVPIGGGAPVTLASGLGYPGPIALDATSVYWTTMWGMVMKVPIGGGPPVTLASGQNNADDIAVDATSVYWTDSTAGTVKKIPVDGGSITTLASGQGRPYRLALNATNLYWTNLSAGTVMMVPLGGGAPVTLASGLNSPGVITVDATSVYWSNDWSQAGGRAVMKMPLGGGAPTTLAWGQFEPLGLAVDAASVYWTDFTDASVMKLTPK